MSHPNKHKENTLTNNIVKAAKAFSCYIPTVYANTPNHDPYHQLTGIPRELIVEMSIDTLINSCNLKNSTTCRKVAALLLYDIYDKQTTLKTNERKLHKQLKLAFELYLFLMENDLQEVTDAELKDLKNIITIAALSPEHGSKHNIILYDLFQLISIRNNEDWQTLEFDSEFWGIDASPINTSSIDQDRDEDLYQHLLVS